MGPGTTVVITGASAGVGKATALAFARRGCRVGLIARDKGRLEDTRREIEALGAQALWIATDVADAEAVDEAASRFEETLGFIDIWVNSAMATVFSTVSAITTEEFRRVIDVTLLGQVWGTMAAVKRMRRRGRGTVVQVGSALAWRAIPLQSAYCAAKHGVRAFTDSLRSELIHDGSPIRLTMVQLPALNTPQFDWARSHLPRRLQPVPPIYQPEVAAEAIVRAAEEAPRELWVGASSIAAIIGSMFFSGAIDRKLAGFGYSGQMTSAVADPERPDNLFAPVPGEAGAHGRFDDRAMPKGMSLRQSTVQGLILGAAALFGGAALALGGRAAYRRLAR